MPEFRIEWVIELPANNPREAAEQAFEIMQRPGTTATHFSVKEFDSPDDAVEVDLLEDQRDAA